MTVIIRQGDVLLRQIAEIPRGTVEIPADPKEGVVLARGERHGHRHMLPYGGAVMYAETGGGSGSSHRYLMVGEPTILAQLGVDDQPTGDHATLDVPKGSYEVIQQRQAEGEKAVYRND